MFQFSSIEQYQAQLRQGTSSCLQAVQHYLRLIDANKVLNAYVRVFDQEAIQRAKELDARREAGAVMGRLHGVVVALKDVIAYKDHPLSAASGILKGFVSLYSSTVVERLLLEEAIIIGTCNCDEFAMGSTNENSTYGPVLNAADQTKVPGGSSGGSAVAVQAGLSMVSLGSDTGGSVRQPADFCGIIGLKPTYGRVSRHGLIAYASSFDQIGIFANTIADVGLLLQVISGQDEFDGTVSSSPVPAYSPGPADQRFRVAYLRPALEHESLDPEIRDSVYSLISNLKAGGHVVEPVEFNLLDYIVPAYYILTTAEASSNLSRYDGARYGHRTADLEPDLVNFYKKSRSEGFGKEVKRRIMLGTFVLSAGYYDAYFSKAQKVRNILTKKIELIFNEFDFIILPTSPTTAFPLGAKMGDPIAMYLADIYTVMANLVGIPAISVPLFAHSNGMPFGIQVAAKRFAELSLLRFSDDLMRSQRKQSKD